MQFGSRSPGLFRITGGSNMEICRPQLGIVARYRAGQRKSKEKYRGINLIVIMLAAFELIKIKLLVVSSCLKLASTIIKLPPWKMLQSKPLTN